MNKSPSSPNIGREGLLLLDSDAYFLRVAVSIVSPVE